MGEEIAFSSDDTDGSARVRHVARGCVSVEYGGMLDGSLAARVVEYFQQIQATGQALTVFVDARRATGYSSEYRHAITTWAKASPSDSLDRIHMLFDSKLMAMGVSVFNMVTGGMITAHTSESAWRDELERTKAPAARASVGANGA